MQKNGKKQVVMLHTFKIILFAVWLPSSLGTLHPLYSVGGKSKTKPGRSWCSTCSK